jgi:predicted DNA-binding transcriptional regulator YafY
MPTAKTTRWLDLLAFLLNRRYPVTREEIFRNVRGYAQGLDPEDERSVQSRRRKFERDKDELRGFGINLETVALPSAEGDEPAQGYQLRPRDFYLPYLEFAKEDAPGARPYQGLKCLPITKADVELLDRATRRVAERTEFPLSAAAASARRKLEFDLPIPIDAVERVLGAPMTREGQKVMAALQRAVAEHAVVRCRYYTIGRDEETEREIEPYGLFFSWGHWYCVARARDRNALRVFRVDRVRETVPLRQGGTSFTVPHDFSIRDYLGRAPWELSADEGVTVRVRFAFPESRWVQAQCVGKVEEPLLEDGGAVLSFDVTDRNPFLRWLLTFRQHAQVIDPANVVQELDELRGRVAGLYTGEPQ